MFRRKPQIGKAVLVGLASGLIASWTMNQFQAALSKASKLAEGQSSQDESKAESEASNQIEEESEDATMKAANRLSEIVLNKQLSKQEKKMAGPVVHYAFGSAMGALYGVAAEVYPNVTRGFGTAFGAALFAIADELAVPVLGLSKESKDVPLSSHASALFAHLTYGAATEGVRRVSMAIL
jgi:hypothetical protein